MHRSRSRARSLAAGSLATALLALVLTGCGGDEKAKAPDSPTFDRAPVILISVDTLRSDRLPAYGYDAIETPAIDAFRRDSILFEHAYSHYPLTLPSHTSMFTGLLPSEHGVRDNVGYPVDTEELPYLPLLLQEAGYATGAAVSTFVLTGDLGLEVGFDSYEDAIEMRRDVPLGGLQRPGGETLDLALSWLDESAKAGEPFFLFFHTYDPHTPYAAPPPFNTRASDPYDAEVLYTDHVLGRLFSELKSRGLYDPALILFVSDHGEGLGDHGEQEHGIFLYRESIQVPMIVKLPGGARAGETVSAPAQLADIAPTVLEALGMPVPERMSGRSVLTLGPEAADRPIYSETYYPRLHMGWNDLASLVQNGYHYIEGPDPELYNLETDPAETENVLRAERRTYASLRDALKPLRADLAGPGEVDAETLQKLAALGYTGGSTSVAEGPLPDPKAQIGALDALKEASRLMAQKDWARAIPVLEGMLAENPRMQDGWEKLALALNRSGQRMQAVEAYQKALENSGGAAHVALSLASLYRELGALEEAREHAELAVGTSPVLAYQHLAEIAMVQEDFEEAERRARAAVKEDPDRPGSSVVLAQVLARQGELEEARQVITRVEKELAESGRTAPVGYHLVRGDIAARTGDPARAAREFQAEIQANPDILDTYARLAVLLVSQGDPQSAVRTLQTMVESNGQSPGAYATAVETFRILGDTQTAGRLLAHARGLYPQDRRLAEMAGG